MMRDRSCGYERGQTFFSFSAVAFRGRRREQRPWWALGLRRGPDARASWPSVCGWVCVQFEREKWTFNLCTYVITQVWEYNPYSFFHFAEQNFLKVAISRHLCTEPLLWQHWGACGVWAIKNSKTMRALRVPTIYGSPDSDYAVQEFPMNLGQMEESMQLFLPFPLVFFRKLYEDPITITITFPSLWWINIY